MTKGITNQVSTFTGPHLHNLHIAWGDKEKAGPRAGMLFADNSYLPPASRPEEVPTWDVRDALGFLEKGEIGVRSYNSEAAAVRYFDVGFPVYIQKGTYITKEVAVEERRYGKRAPKKAMVVRWRLSHHALGSYLFHASFKIGDSKNIEYKVYRSDGIPSGNFWRVDFRIPAAIAFDIVELVQFEDEARPFFVIRSSNKNGNRAIWERFSRDEFTILGSYKGKDLCLSHHGVFLEETRLGDGWCRYWKSEDTIDTLLTKHFRERFGWRYLDAIREGSPARKLLKVSELVDEMLRTPYAVECRGKEKESGACFDRSDLEKMEEEAKTYQDILYQDLIDK